MIDIIIFSIKLIIDLFIQQICTKALNCVPGGHIDTVEPRMEQY
jgi:hypothetical protein